MPSSDLLILVACYAIAINLVAFLAFAWDKFCARNQLRRVPEQTLLTLALIGGTLGALIGKWTLRHKTRKQPFVTYLRCVILAQAVLLVVLSFPQGRHTLWAVARTVFG